MTCALFFKWLVQRAYYISLIWLQGIVVSAVAMESQSLPNVITDTLCLPRVPSLITLCLITLSNHFINDTNPTRPLALKKDLETCLETIILTDTLRHDFDFYLRKGATPIWLVTHISRTLSLTQCSWPFAVYIDSYNNSDACFIYDLRDHTKCEILLNLGSLGAVKACGIASNGSLAVQVEQNLMMYSKSESAYKLAASLHNIEPLSHLTLAANASFIAGVDEKNRTIEVYNFYNSTLKPVTQISTAHMDNTVPRLCFKVCTLSVNGLETKGVLLGCYNINTTADNKAVFFPSDNTQRTIYVQADEDGKKILSWLREHSENTGGIVESDNSTLRFNLPCISRTLLKFDLDDMHQFSKPILVRIALAQAFKRDFEGDLLNIMKNEKLLDCFSQQNVTLLRHTIECWHKEFLLKRRDFVDKYVNEIHSEEGIEHINNIFSHLDRDTQVLLNQAIDRKGEWWTSTLEEFYKFLSQSKIPFIYYENNDPQLGSLWFNIASPHFPNIAQSFSSSICSSCNRFHIRFLQQFFGRCQDNLDINLRYEDSPPHNFNELNDDQFNEGFLWPHQMQQKKISTFGLFVAQCIQRIHKSINNAMRDCDQNGSLEDTINLLLKFSPRILPPETFLKVKNKMRDITAKKIIAEAERSQDPYVDILNNIVTRLQSGDEVRHYHSTPLFDEVDQKLLRIALEKDTHPKIIQGLSTIEDVVSFNNSIARRKMAKDGNHHDINEHAQEDCRKALRQKAREVLVATGKRKLNVGESIIEVYGALLKVQEENRDIFESSKSKSYSYDDTRFYPIWQHYVNAINPDYKKVFPLELGPRL